MRWSVPAVAAVALTLDAVLFHWVTGLLSSAAMLATSLWSLVRFVKHRGHSRAWRLRRNLWAFASLAGLGALAARAHLSWVEARAAAPVDHSGLVRTYLTLFVLASLVAMSSTTAPRRVSSLLVAATLRPAAALMLSFATLIGVGTLLLILPVSVQRLEDISLIDALFTITSAVCVTGLAVNDIGGTYTGFGQGVILGCVQLGGIGIMTIAGLVTVSRTGSSLEEQSQLATMLEVDGLRELKRMLRAVVFGTLVMEALGGVLLWLAFRGDPRLEGASAVWNAVFHAVSAFCNAGFSPLTGNLMRFRDAPFVQLVIASLTVLGGLGFPVLLELMRVGWRRLRRRLGFGKVGVLRLSVHARTVLLGSALLLVGGGALLTVLEWSASLSGVGPVQSVFNAFFMSAVSRSSGFVTVEVGAFRNASLLIVCILMFVGGAPASTAGGIKVTTAAVLVAVLRGELMRRPVSLFRRAVPAEVMQRAGAVLTLSAAVVLGATVLLTLTESHPFIAVLFEATSAFATAGLSTGITDELSGVGRLVLTVTMFVGRVGPFTIALAARATDGRARYRLAEEGLIVG